MVIPLIIFLSIAGPSWGTEANERLHQLPDEAGRTSSPVDLEFATLITQLGNKKFTEREWAQSQLQKFLRDPDLVDTRWRKIITQLRTAADHEGNDVEIRSRARKLLATTNLNWLEYFDCLEKKVSGQLEPLRYLAKVIDQGLKIHGKEDRSPWLANTVSKISETLAQGPRSESYTVLKKEEGRPMMAVRVSPPGLRVDINLYDEKTMEFTLGLGSAAQKPSEDGYPSKPIFLTVSDDGCLSPPQRRVYSELAAPSIFKFQLSNEGYVKVGAHETTFLVGSPHEKLTSNNRRFLADVEDELRMKIPKPELSAFDKALIDKTAVSPKGPLRIPWYQWTPVSE